MVYPTSNPRWFHPKLPQLGRCFFGRWKPCVTPYTPTWMWHHGTLTAAIDWNLIQKILLSVEHPSTNGSLVVWAPVVWNSNRGTPKNPFLPFMFGDPIGIQTTGPQTTNLTLAEAYKKELFTVAPRIAWFLMIFGALRCLDFFKSLQQTARKSHFIQTRLGSNSPNDNKKYTSMF